MLTFQQACQVTDFVQAEMRAAQADEIRPCLTGVIERCAGGFDIGLRDLDVLCGSLMYTRFWGDPFHVEQRRSAISSDAGAERLELFQGDGT